MNWSSDKRIETDRGEVCRVLGTIDHHLASPKYVVAFKRKSFVVGAGNVEFERVEVFFPSGTSTTSITTLRNKELEFDTFFNLYTGCGAGFPGGTAYATKEQAAANRGDKYCLGVFKLTFGVNEHDGSSYFKHATRIE